MNHVRQSTLIHRSVRISATGLLPFLLLLLAAVAQAQFTYTTNNGTITITGYTGPGGNVTIPSLINGLPVTSIGDYAFLYCTSLINVTIGSSVTSIGVYAFRECSRLNSVTIPNGVTSIGYGAFNSCIRLTNVTIGNSVTTIGDGVFFGCTGLTSVMIPNSVTSIGSDAFDSCTSLTSVMIPNSVTNIGPGAFEACTSLPAITVDVLNTDCSSVAGVLFNKSQTTLHECPAGKAGTSYTIPSSVTNIAERAFGSCTRLTSVTIGNSVTSIGNSAFGSCASLTGVTIPNSVTSIGDGAFTDCYYLTRITIGNSVISIGYLAFCLCGLSSVTIPSSVTSIGQDAFGYCGNMKGIYFKGNAPRLGGTNVFSYANDVTVYYLPGTTGWGTTYGGRPTALWNPSIQTTNASFGVRTNQFGFTITGTTNIPIVVEASIDLATASWTPLQTCTLTNSSIYFTDPQWTNYPARFYRLRSP